MAGIFKSLMRVMTGQVIRRSDVPLMNGTCVMSFRVKREREGLYVVLAADSPGNHQFYPFEITEFDRFVEAAIEIRTALHSTVDHTEQAGGVLYNWIAS